MTTAKPYFEQTHSDDGGFFPVLLTLDEDPLNPGNLMLTLDAGIKTRARLDEASANYLADAIHRWYASPDDKEKEA